MNNISRLPINVDYPHVDMDALRRAEAGAASAGITVKSLFIQTHYLPALHSRINELDAAMRTAKFKIRDTVQSLDIRLDIELRTVRSLQAEFVGATESDKAEVIEDIAKRVATIINTVSKNEIVLRRLIPAMTAPVERSATGGYLAQLEADETRLPAELQDIKGRQEKLEEKRRSLTEAMALIESKGFANLAKDTALTSEGILKLGVASPEMAAIKAGIELAHQVLERAEQLISYMGLVEARNAVRKQIDDLITKTHERNTELAMIALKKDLIMACYAFDDHRGHYIAEFQKLITAKQSFIKAYEAVSADDTGAVTQFVVDALSLAKHLNAAR